MVKFITKTVCIALFAALSIGNLNAQSIETYDVDAIFDVVDNNKAECFTPPSSRVEHKLAYYDVDHEHFYVIGNNIWEGVRYCSGGIFFTAEQMLPYEGMHITKIRYRQPNQANYLPGFDPSYTKVWLKKGETGVVFYEQNLTPIDNDWNTVVLTTPQLIEAGPLMIGYSLKINPVSGQNCRPFYVSAGDENPYVYGGMHYFVNGVENNHHTVTNWSKYTGQGNLALEGYAEDGNPGGDVIITTEVTPAGAGTVTGAGTYQIGDPVTLKATANSGYKFDKWTPGNFTDNPYTFTAVSSTTYTANFKIVPVGDCNPAKNLNVVYSTNCGKATLTWDEPSKGRDWPYEEQFNWSLSGMGTTTSVATDGNFVYVGCYTNNTVRKLSMTGASLGTFTIPGITALRALSYDGTNFYGANATSEFWKLDMVNGAILETIPIAQGNTARSLAYDPIEDGFWIADYNNGNTLFLISKTGAKIRQIQPPDPFKSLYGTAVDHVTPGGPYLFGVTAIQSQKPNIYQINLNTGAVTDKSLLEVGDNSGGGMFFTNKVVTDTWTLMCLIQNASIKGWKIAEGEAPQYNKYNIYRDGSLIKENLLSVTTFDDTTFDPEKEHKWAVKVVCSNGGESDEVSFTKERCKGPCNPASGLTVDITEKPCKATLKWTAAPEMPGAKYNVYRGTTKIGSDIAATEFVDDNFPANVEQTWSVKTICQTGEATAVSVKGKCDDVSITELANSISIYPNPAANEVTIIAAGFAKVEIYNTVGQLIETKTVDVVDVSSYNTGIYFFKVYDENNNSVTKRIMVAR